MTTTDHRAREVIENFLEPLIEFGNAKYKAEAGAVALLSLLNAAALRVVEHGSIVGTAEELTEFVIADLEASGRQIIDTSTHVAVPREPTPEMVERARQAIGVETRDWPEPLVFDELDSVARAAIAAITGGPDAV